jgi:hypothetical protein
MGFFDGRYNSCDDRGVRSYTKMIPTTSFIVGRGSLFSFLFIGVINDYGMETESGCVNVVYQVEDVGKIAKLSYRNTIATMPITPATHARIDLLHPLVRARMAGDRVPDRV